MSRAFSRTLLWFVWTSLLLTLSSCSPLLSSFSLESSNGGNLTTLVSITEQTTFYVLKLIAVVILVLMGAVFAGLTLGLMGLDLTNLQVIKETGSPDERYNAGKVLQLLDHGKHWVLVTLLLSNVIVNETLPIILDSLFGGGWQAILISTALIVIFGEIIPQSICVRHGLSIGAKCSTLVLILMYIMYPIGYPTSLLLDHFLGKTQGTVYKKAGLKSLVSLHQSENVSDGLTEDEVLIIGSVLDLRDKPVSKVMTPIQDVFTLSLDAILDKETVDKILFHGFSRIPISTTDDKSNFVGMLLVKQLITYDIDDALPVRYFDLSALPETSPDTSCLDILNFFQEGKSHLALISSNPGGVGGALGVITLEDVIEELIGEEIIDETDIYVDVHKKVKVVRRQPKPYVSNIQSLLKMVRSTSSTQDNSIQHHKGVTCSKQDQLLPAPPSYDHTQRQQPHQQDYGATVIGSPHIINGKPTADKKTQS
ncbi:uncharacterized protein BX664DRAFT_333417 [Halteromyces radiatus]|uniref:uncharacterized protein n=1 Tax=Halteromyces radiatus TaxID=101107 RepID=UPI00221FBBFD|nr:uncharacterized protein BX664DRAFT_333417 [Halteromyces radiatus]KAI8089592.1 hypothetical protein BX664DRAFT_333417 [Halteromyces radiatus]